MLRKLYPKVSLNCFMSSLVTGNVVNVKSMRENIFLFLSALHIFKFISQWFELVISTATLKHVVLKTTSCKRYNFWSLSNFSSQLFPSCLKNRTSEFFFHYVEHFFARFFFKLKFFFKTTNFSYGVHYS